MRIFAHIVTFNSSATIESCLLSLAQVKDLHLEITDNASTDETCQVIEQAFPQIKLYKNNENLGFCAAHNQAVGRFLARDYEYFVTVNPDLAVASDCFEHLTQSLARDAAVGLGSPKLLRADSSLKPLEPRVLDACGMVLNASLRHFDRGAGEYDAGQFNQTEKVFGGTGALLCIKRECVKDTILEAARDQEIVSVFPRLAPDSKLRPQLFDEAFFAFREDADLSWRAEKLGWGCLYVPTAVAYHVRNVLPERRKQLPPEINLHGVRNRFLLQLNNYSFSERPLAFLAGVLLRNIAVVLGVFLVERSSLEALRQVVALLPRALARRRELVRKIALKRPMAAPS